MQLPKAYIPQEYEDKIYQQWEKSGYFNPDNFPKPKKTNLANEFAKANFSISMPPPNATGVLHVGHALGIAIQDILIRYHRMKGDRSLWVPGVDHASIATQNVVEKILRKQGTSRHKLGRKEFLIRTKKYVADSKATIENQTRKIGASCDWSRQAYTLSGRLSRAVTFQFCRMYEDGLLYRGNRIVNWCPRCGSTLADDEVDHETRKTKLYTFKYSHNFPFAIATTRPETKLGDTGVAVHPEDKRYLQYIDNDYCVDFLGIPLDLKVVAYYDIDPEFGTGALGLTPAHSVTDWKIGINKDLNIKNVIGMDGKILPGLGQFSGMKTVEARAKIVELLKQQNLLQAEEEIEHNLSICYRCKNPIEPLPSNQWFVAVDKPFKIRNKQLKARLGQEKASLKQIAKWAVESGEVKIIPERFEKIYFHWMDNLHDWCVSRQLWFGHRIPAYYKKTRNHLVTKAPEQKQQVEIIYFVHGSTPDNENDIRTGWADDKGLSELGKQQVRDLKQAIADQIKSFDVVYSSDFNRARQTAELVFGDTHKIIYDQRLRECDYGALNGLGQSKFNPDEKYYIDQNFPDGENCYDIEKRIKNFIEEVKQKYIGKKIAVISHKYPQLAFEVITNNKTWPQAFNQDWRHQKDWQPGWRYTLEYDGSNKDNNELEYKTKYIEINFRDYEIFDLIKSNQKTIETRALNPEEPDRYFGNIKSGDNIVFNYKQGDEISQSLIVTVKQVKIFRNEKEMLNHCDINKIYPGGSKLKLIDLWKNNAGYSEKIRKNGIIAFYLDRPRPYNKNITIKVCPDNPDQDNWRQDEDTLDTWFSSALWTFSTLLNKDYEKYHSFDDWVKNSPDLQTFHPTSVMETMHDILFFWVARMVMMTLYTLNQVPFKTVYLHGMVCDKNGKKMSKSHPETCIEPIEVAEKYGTDALRLSLIIGNTAGNNLKLSEPKIASFRNFANKLWNIGRFIQLSTGDYQLSTGNFKTITLADRWIASRMNNLIKEVSIDLESFRFSLAGEKLYNFTWHELADWYVEIAKFQNNTNSYNLLFNIYNLLLKLLHPFTPFVTEAIWRFFNPTTMLMIEKWPQSDANYINTQAEQDFGLIQELVTSIRSWRKDKGLFPKDVVKLQIAGASDILQSQKLLIEYLAKIKFELLPDLANSDFTIENLKIKFL